MLGYIIRGKGRNYLGNVQIFFGKSLSVQGDEGAKGRGDEGTRILLRPMVISHLRPTPSRSLHLCLLNHPSPQCCLLNHPLPLHFCLTTPRPCIFACLTTPRPSFKRRGVRRGAWRGSKRHRHSHRQKVCQCCVSGVSPTVTLQPFVYRGCAVVSVFFMFFLCTLILR